MSLAPRRRSLAFALTLTLGSGLAACAPTVERACSGDTDCPPGERCTATGRCVPPPGAPGADDEGVATPDALGEGDRGRAADARMPPVADLAVTPPTPDLGVAPADAAPPAPADAAPPMPDVPVVLPPDASVAPPPDAGVGEDMGPVTSGDAMADALPPPADAAQPTPDACVEAAEVCNGLDDDCNGSADDGPDGTPLVVECYEGDPATRGQGVCHGGHALCSGGRPLPCEAQVLPALETCNGLDDDCDGRLDDVAGIGDPCAEGVGACRAVGSLVCSPERGGLVCTASPGFGTPEVCNGVDDDCNGQTDDSVLAEEVCNGADDDCDGHADEGFNVGADCSQGVGACQQSGVYECTGDGRRQCSAVALPAAVETCDGTDENCNGRVDDVQGLDEGCVSGQGLCARVGRTVCRMGSDEPVCGAVPGIPEVEERCDDLDHDCDGVTRDVPNAQIATGVPYVNLSVLNAGCGEWGGELAGRYCSAAIHQYCARQNGCWTSGFGPTFADGSTMTADVVCLHDGVRIVRTTQAVLTRHHPSCNATGKLGGIYCNAAIDNLCSTMSERGGYGPVGFDAAGNVDIACIGGPLVVDRVTVPWATLTAIHGDCNPDSAQAQAGGPCMFAANQHCVRAQYYAGFGPVQDVNGQALVICLQR